ncbi:MAG: hypothetical protein Q9220_007812 [cf. Caloplaca sp. 1 TL-2023]
MLMFDDCSDSSSVVSWLSDHPEDPKDYDSSLDSNWDTRHCLGPIEPSTVLMVSPSRSPPKSPVEERRRNAMASRPSVTAAPRDTIYEDTNQENAETRKASRDAAAHADLEDLQSGHGLLPASIRQATKQHLLPDRDRYYDNEIDDAGKASAHNAMRAWYDVLEASLAAGRCKMMDAPEALWNADVNYPLLRIALRGHWKSQEVWYNDLTTARISDKDLLPKVPGTNPKSKMVDLGIVIEPYYAGPLWKKIARRCELWPYGSVNQTDAPHVSHTPIAISGEVKRAAGDEMESVVQLETWVTAHFLYLLSLLKLRNSTAKPPALPLLQIIGSRWRLVIAEMKVEEDEIIMHSSVELGSTNSILGTYKIIASIRRLARWVSEQYRPWWMNNILGFDERIGTSADDASRADGPT